MYQFTAYMRNGDKRSTTEIKGFPSTASLRTFRAKLELENGLLQARGKGQITSYELTEPVLSRISQKVFFQPSLQATLELLLDSVGAMYGEE